MPTITASLTDGSKISFDDGEIGRGVEKVVFLTTDGKQVVCFFNNTLADRPQRVSRLQKILTGFNPTLAGQKNADYWIGHYCWPTGMIDDVRGEIPVQFLRGNGLLTPALAVVAPRYRENFYFTNAANKKVEGNVFWFVKEKPRRAVPDGNRGTLMTNLKVTGKLARAVRRMHTAGLAHSDLSNNNVLVDPLRGDSCIIDIDALVVPHFAPPLVLGTAGYIAPEVISKQIINGKVAQPCIQTDRYALGVLIYELLLLRHPIEREKPVDPKLDAEKDTELAFGSQALFCEHPKDPRNHRRVPPVIPMTRLGPYLADLFYRLFIDGLHDREKRPHAYEWESAIYHTMNLLHPACDGALAVTKDTDFFVLSTNMPMDPPTIRKRLPRPVPYALFYQQGRNGQGLLAQTTLGKRVTYHDSLTIWNMRPLYEWHVRRHVEPNEDCTNMKAVGLFRFWNNDWWLSNQGPYPLTRLDGGQPIPPGESIQITPGLRLQMLPGAEGRVFEFQFKKP